MKYAECLLLWDEPGGHTDIDRPKVLVTKLGAYDRDYPFSLGAVMIETRQSVGDVLLMWMLRDLAYLLMSVGADRTDVHNEFMKVDEYREHFADWTP